ncbi:MAG TPA: SAP domain-containing protein [Thermoplasmata archaeon]|nr:SAP domain-containing protein [Thermoplasmata archaeon]
MADESGPPPPGDPAELAADLCPNCGRKLKFSENRPEGLCASCGIFVEVLRPSSSKPRTPVRALPPKMTIRTATARDLVVLCHKYGLPSDGTKEDLVARLLFYVDEQNWQAKVSAAKPEKPASPPTEDIASRKQWAQFFLNYETEVEEEGLEPKDEKEAPAEPSRPKAVEPSAETVAKQRAETVPVETAPSPEVASESSPPEVPPEPLLPEEHAREGPEAPDRESSAEAVKEAELPPPPEAEAMSEPVPEVVLVPVERAFPVLPAESLPVRSRTPPVQRSPLRRAAYYAGVFDVAIGGAGLILGSILHDIFRVPFFGRAYDAFGPLNLGAVFIGVVFLGVGFAAMAVGLRRTATRARSAAGA